MKNAFKCTLEELTIKCIFKRLVGVHTVGSWLQHSDDARHGDFFVQGFLCYEASLLQSFNCKN